MLGEKPRPKPRGKYCRRCNAWYRPSKYRSAGKDLEYCSKRCMLRAKAESEIGQPGTGRREW